MRCLTLADVLKKQGAHIRFLCKNLPAHLIDMLIKTGMEYIALGENLIEDSIDNLIDVNLFCISQKQDYQATRNALSDQVWDWLIVDHYGLDFRWEGALRSSARHILVIDDIADRQHDCDILLDQNYYADMQMRYDGKAPDHCQLLLGPDYSLLREEFRMLREKIKIRNGKIKKILIFFGGVDSENYTTKAIEALSEINAELQVDVVIGAQHPFKEQIHSACINNNYICHMQTPHIARLMAEADLALGAGGSASWERCCLGLPSLLVALADNQIAIARELSDINACVYIGNRDEVNASNLKKWVRQLLANPNHIKKMSEKAFSITDGFGVFRVINKMRFYK